MSITELSIKRPILFIVFYIVLIGLGIFSYSTLKYELLPNIAAPFVSVVTEYQGASPQTVEDAVTKKLEDGLSSVSKVKKMSSTSSESLSVIGLEFNQDANPDEATQTVQRAINQVVSTLPKNCKTPSVEKFNLNDLPVLVISATSKMEINDLRKLIKNQIKTRLAKIPNIGQIALKGGEEQEIKILLNKDKINGLNLSTLQIVDALNKANVSIPLGNIEQSDLKLNLRLDGKFNSIEEINEIIVLENIDKSKIYLKDIAKIEYGSKAKSSINSLNKINTIGINIQKQSGSNAVELSEKARAELTSIENDFKNIELKFSIAQDSSEYTLKAAKTVYKDFFIALLLVSLIMLVFLHSVRNAVIVMIAIPTSLVTAFIMMYLMDFTLNIMTLLAMSLVIGILVDDSIVVLENIYKHLEMGKNKAVAALDGRNEIGFAALSITLVDIVVFLPLIMVPGVTGSLIKGFSLIIVVSTLTSLLVSFTLTPMMASRFARLEHLSAKTFGGKILMATERFLNNITKKYIQLLKLSLRHRLATIMICVVLLFSSFGLVIFGYIGAEFIPSADKGEISIAVTLQPGIKIEETKKIVSNLENKITNIKEITSIATTIGDKSDGLNTVSASNVATINIKCIPANEREKSIKDIARDIRKIANNFAGINLQISPIGMVGAEATPIQIVAYGKNRDDVLKASELVVSKIQGIDGAIYPRISTEVGKPEINFKIDRYKLSELGLNYEDVGVTIRTVVNGFDDLKTTINNEELDIRIQFENSEKFSINDLNNLSFINNSGQKITLNQFASINIMASPSNLERRNKSNCVIIAAQVIGRSSGEVGAEIVEKLEKEKLPGDVKLSYEGDLEQQGDSFALLGLAFLVSILLVYLNMVVLYNNWMYPFIILFSIPVALVGALLALALSQNSLNLFSLFGMIMLQGLVAKNAILLVDRANHLREKENRSMFYALLEAGKSRLRPILMTTLAMVIGLLPLALDSGSGSELNKPMAWVLIGGLSSSMFLTLVLVPAIYVQIVNFSNKFKKNKTSIIPKNAIAILLFIGFSFYSQNTNSQTKISIDDAVTLGLKNNENIKIAALETDLSNSKIKEIQSYLYPNVSFVSQFRRNFKPSVFFLPNEEGELRAVPAENKNAFSGVLEMSMPIYNGELNKNISISKKTKELTILQKEQIQKELKFEIKKAYLDVLIAIEYEKIQNEALKRNKFTLQETKNKLKLGLVTDADTLKVFVEVKNVDIEILKAKNQIKVAQKTLKNLISIEDENIELSDNLNNLKIIETTKINDENSFKERTDFKTISKKLEISNLEIEKSKQNYYPKVSLIGQYQKQTQADDFRFNEYVWSENYFLGLQVNVPIFAGFINKSKSEQAQIQQKQSELELQKVQKNALTEIEQSKEEIEIIKKRLKTAQVVNQASKRSFNLLSSQYKAGIIKYGDLLDAEIALKQSNLSNLVSLFDYWLVFYKYEYNQGL